MAASPNRSKLATLYREVADAVWLRLLRCGTVAGTTPLDGVHLDAANTRAIGAALAPVVRQMLGL